MPAASRYLMLLCAGLCFALTFGAFLVYERPGLGVGHFYYLGIALAAMAVGPRLGVVAGLLATGLYAGGVVLNPHIQSDEVLRVGTLTRAFTYVTIGALIGWFAGRNRMMLAELRVLAKRDTQATLGWATFPHECDNALALYRAASERLYARKVMRSYLRPVPEPVEALG